MLNAIIPLNLAAKYIFFTLCWLIKLSVKTVVIGCKTPVKGSKTARQQWSFPWFYHFSLWGGKKINKKERGLNK